MLQQAKKVLGRARLLTQFVGVFVFVACGYLLPRATRIVVGKTTNKGSTGKGDDASTPISRPVGQAESADPGLPNAPGGAGRRAGADASMEAVDNDRESSAQATFQRSGIADGAGRRASSSVKALAAAACVVGGSVCSASLAVASDAPRYMSVEYADSLEGTQALFAAKVCALNEATSLGVQFPLRGYVALNDVEPPSVFGPFGAPSWFHVTRMDTSSAIAVRVFDGDGREISRHEGSHDVCGYARIAVAFIVGTGARAPGDAR